jgi:uroporphyrin-III C-methyltransferase/precorrin-2 dehydrogenase/sirohydrochlorin ferrochelatase
MATQRTLWSTLAEVAEDLDRSGIRPPAVVVVGEVVAVANPTRYPGRSVPAQDGRAAAGV